MHAGSLRSQIGGKTMHAGSLRSQIGGLDRHCPRTYTPELASQQASWHALPVLDAVKWVLGASDWVSEAPSEVGEVGVPNTPFYIQVKLWQKRKKNHKRPSRELTRDPSKRG